MAQLSIQLRAAILADFLYQYNRRWNEDWTIEIRKDYDQVRIFRKTSEICCDGHFVGQLIDFCREKFNTTPCVGYFSEHLEFYF